MSGVVSAGRAGERAGAVLAGKAGGRRGGRWRWVAAGAVVLVAAGGVAAGVTGGFGRWLAGAGSWSRGSGEEHEEDQERGPMDLSRP